MYTVNFEMPAFILSFLCLVYCLTAKRRQYKPPKGIKNKLLSQHFIFLLLLLSNLFSSLSSVIGVYLQQFTSSIVKPWMYFFHAMYFFFHSTLSICFTLYIMNVNGTSAGRKRLFYVLFTLPYIISELIVLTNNFTGLAFSIDSKNVYHRGPLMPVLYACGAIYIIIGFVMFYKYKQAVSHSDSVTIGTVIVIATLGIIVQAVRSDLLVELFFEALAFLVLMMLLEEKSGRTDPLTGVLNRAAFSEANRRLIKTGKSYNIILIKIANYSSFSRSFKSRETDSLLVNIAAWLTLLTSEEDVYCLRQAEFALIRTGETEEKSMEHVNVIFDRFERGWKIGTVNMKADVIVSMLKVPEHVSTPEQLEDIISVGYHKKKSGSYFVQYSELSDLQKNNYMESALENAVANGDLEVRYQPIWSNKEKRTVAAEALIRVTDERLKNVSPEIFIPIAEKDGLIKQIGLFVFEDVCRMLKSERLCNSGVRYIEINLSVYQFMYDDLIDSFEKIRNKYGVPAESINLEITETAYMDGSDDVRKMIGKLRDIGYTFSLDDFGTGYSNFVRLINVKYKNVKIDKSVLWDAEKSEAGSHLHKSLMKTIPGFGSDIIQEGVETKEQLDKVVSLGCDLIQGYYFSPPLPKKEFFEYLDAEGKGGIA